MLLIALPLMGCGSEPSNRTAGGVTPDEARALDDAAQMVEARRLPAEALRQPVAPASVAASGAPSTGDQASPSATGESRQ